MPDSPRVPEGFRPTLIRLERDESDQEIIAGIFSIDTKDYDIDKANEAGQEEGYRFVYPKDYEAELVRHGKRVRYVGITAIIEDIELAG